MNFNSSTCSEGVRAGNQASQGDSFCKVWLNCKGTYVNAFLYLDVKTTLRTNAQKEMTLSTSLCFTSIAYVSLSHLSEESLFILHLISLLSPYAYSPSLRLPSLA